MTPSGVLLNSLVLDFSWPQKAAEQQMDEVPCSHPASSSRFNLFYFSNILFFCAPGKQTSARKEALDVSDAHYSGASLA